MKKLIILKKMLLSLIAINLLTLNTLSYFSTYATTESSSIVEQEETFTFSLPTVESEVWRAVTVTKECSSIDIILSGEFESSVSCAVYAAQDTSSECFGERGIGLYGSYAITEETNLPVFIENPGTYWIYITNSSNINSYYYEGVNTTTLTCNYKVLLGDSNENNNTYDKAIPLIENTKQEFTLLGVEDTDFFKFTVYDLENPLKITIESGNENGIFDTNITRVLYRLSEYTGELEAVKSGTIGRNNTTTYTLEDTGNYYLRINNAFTANPYYYSYKDNKTPLYITSNFSYDDTTEPIDLAENEYMIKVYDKEGAVKDQTVDINGNHYVTDERGYVIFELTDEQIKEGTVSVSIQSDKHSTYYMDPFYINKLTKISFIKLKFKGESDYELMGARINEYDILNGTKKSCLRDDVSTEIILQPYSEIGIRKYAIMQNDEIIAESIYRNVTVKGGDFKEGEDVYAVIYGNETDADGNYIELSKTMLNIKVISIDSEYIKKLSFGEKIKFTVIDVPYFDNTEFEIDFNESDGFLTYEIEDDSVKIGYNINVSGLSSKEIFKQLLEKDSETDEETGDDNPEFSIKTSTGMYSELKFSDGLLVSSGGSAFVKLKVKGKAHKDFIAKVPIVTIFVPMTVGISVEGTLKFTPSVQTNVYTNKVEFSNELEAQIKAELNLGVGKNDYSAGGYGSGSIKVIYKNLSELEMIEAEIEAGLYAKIGILEAKQRLTEETKFTLYEKGETTTNLAAYSALKSMVAAVNDVENYSVINRDYLSSRSEINEKGVSIRNYIKDIQTNAYPYIEPQIVSCNNQNIVMAYLDDDGEEDNANFQHLVFSIYNSSDDRWSKPIKVDDNKYNENSFHLYTDNNDIYLAYTELNDMITTETSPEDMAKKQEIMVAKFDATEGKFVNITKITNNETYDSTPKIAVVNGTPIVTWINNSDNNMLGTTSNNSICYSKYENDVWTEPETLISNVNTVIQMEAGILDSNFEIAYITDEDSDLATYEDRKLNTINLNKQNNVVVSDINKDTYLQFINYQGKDTLVWKKGNIIQGISSKDGTISNIYENDNLSAVQKVKMTKYLDNEYMLTYIKDAGLETNGSKLYGVRCMEGSWKGEQLIYDNENYADAYAIAPVRYTGRMACVMVSSTFDSETYSKITTLSSKIIVKTNNAAITDVTDVEINGNTVNMKVTVSNTGDYEYDFSKLMIKDNDDNDIYEKDVDILLDSGETKTIDVEFTLDNPISKEGYKISMFSPTYYSLPYYSFSLCHVDLSVASEQIKMNNKNYISMKVTNNGYYTAKSRIDLYKVNATEESMTDELVRTIVVPELGYGESANYVIEVTDDYMISGKTEGVIKMIATPVENVTETVPLDNTSSVAIADFTEELEYPLGDVNADGVVNARDAKLAIQHFTGKIVLTDDQIARGDVYADGDINARDAKLIIQFFTGKISSF